MSAIDRAVVHDDRAALAPDPQDVAERQRAARALLLEPLITASGPRAEDLRLIRRHQAELTRLFAEGLGYRLQVDPVAARLYKTGLGRDATRPLRRDAPRPARRGTGPAFTPRAYAMLCLVLAALTRSKSQLLVDELVQEVRSAAVDAGLDVDLDAYSDRRALHAAFSALVRFGVLTERDGNLEHWVDQRAQALLDVRRDLLPLVVAAPLSAADGPESLLDVVALPSAAGGARAAIRRRLVESPLMTTDSLTEDQAEWWARNRNRERDWYQDRFGLVLELRAEGAAAIDPDDELSDDAFPGQDKTRQLALLILEALAAHVRHEAGAAGAGSGDRSRTGAAWHAIPASTVHRLARAVADEWSARLRRDQREDPDGAVRAALAVLEAFGLVRHTADTVQVHAAAARYAPRVLAHAATSGERSLFDPPDNDGDDDE